MTTASDYGASPAGVMASPGSPASAPSPSDASTPLSSKQQSQPQLLPPPPPPEREFESRDELLAYVRGFTVAHGYAVVISKSNVPRGQVWLRCDLGGSQRAASPGTAEGGSRKRKSASRRQECPFQLYGRRLQSARWALRVQDARHNHDVAADAEQMVAHPVARRLSLEQKLYVQELTERGVRPAMIVEHLKDRFPDKPVKVQDIYNARNYIRRERNAGREPFSRPDGWSAPCDTQLDGGQQATRQDGGVAPALRCDSAPPSEGGDASGKQQALKEWRSMDGRLQNALQRVSREFPRWGTQRQRYFVSQLEHLLGECSQTEATHDASEEQRIGGGSIRGGEEDPTLAVQQASPPDEGERGPSSPFERASDLLIAPPSPHPSPPPSPPPSSPPPSGLPSPPPSSAKIEIEQAAEGDGGLSGRAEASAQPSISL